MLGQQGDVYVLYTTWNPSYILFIKAYAEHAHRQHSACRTAYQVWLKYTLSLQQVARY